MNQENIDNEVYYDETTIDFSKVWDTLVEKRNIIFVITASFFVIAAIYSLIVTPIYRASATISFATDGGSESMNSINAVAAKFGGLASLGGINIASSATNRETAVATLESRKFTEMFMRQEGILQILNEDDWDKELGQWKDKDNIPSYAKAVRIFSKMRVVNIDIKTGLITITMDWEDKDLAAEWINKMVKQVNQQLQTKQVDDYQRHILFLKKEIQDITNIELANNLYSLIADETNKMMVAATREDYVFTIIDPAIPPDLRFSPKRKILAISGGLLGLIASFFYVFFIESLLKKKEDDA